MNQTIGRYQVEETIGRGGMGVVYKAFDPVLQRTVALKVLSGITLDDPDARERLMREARSAGQLAHKNIIVIHDLGEDQGQPYVAMEYLTGMSLEAHLRRGPIPLERIVDFIVQVCEGLEYAHRRDIVHRDIKPANLFVTESGEVKIVDFGLVQIVSSSLTRSQSVMGTASYMSPEQVRGERVDQRADLFATGAVLYELVARRKAFQGDSVATTMYRILQGAPDPLVQYCPNVPTALADVVDRALAKDPAQRYQNAADMRRDLEACREPAAIRSQVMDSPTIVTPSPSAVMASASSPPSVIWSPRRIRSTAIIGAILTAAFAGTLLWAPRDGQQPVSTADGLADTPAARSVDSASETTTPPTVAQLPSAAPAPAVTSDPRPQPDERRAPAAGSAAPSPPGLPERLSAVPPGAGIATAAGRQAIAAAVARVAEARSAADAADAPALATAQYRAAAALEAEANALASSTSPPAEATSRFVEAEARFRAAAIEARAEARLRAVEAQPPSRPSAPTPQAALPEPPGLPERLGAVPSGVPRADARPPEPPPRTPDAEAPPSRPADAKPSGDSAPPRAAVNNEALVREVVAQYVAGLEGRSMAALKRVWPTLSGAQERAIQAEFANARSVQARFTDPRIEINGDVTTVSGVREYRLVTQDGQQLSTVTRTTLTLRRAGDGWHIERIVHQPR